MISKRSKEKFVKSKSLEEKVQNIREIYDAVFQNPGNSLAKLPIIMILHLLTYVNENIASSTSVSDLALFWQFVTFSSVQCNFPVQFLRRY